jgi:cell wall-associated NlpC family hydrolase
MFNSTLPPRAVLPLRPLALALGLIFAAVPFAHGAHGEEADATANAPLPAASLTDATDREPLFDINSPDFDPDLDQAAQFDLISFAAEGVADQGLLAHAHLTNTQADGQDPVSALFSRIFSFSPDKDAAPYDSLSEFESATELKSIVTIPAEQTYLGSGLRITSQADNENSEFADDDTEDDYSEDDENSTDTPHITRITYSATRKLLDEGLSYLGIRYRPGGRSRDTGFDCSGLVLSAFRNALGLDLPHSSRALAGRGTYVGIKDLRPGDLVFFNVTRRVISHVGIYVGDGKFLHSPSVGSAVRIDALSSRYWAKRYATARRMLDEDQQFDVSSFEPFTGPPEPAAIR